jgi:hypothetical protein
VGDQGVGSGGVILHYDGNEWSSMNTPKSLEWVSGNSASDIFAVGSGGTILHYDGRVWTDMNSGTTNDFSGVWEDTSSDVFVASPNGAAIP